MTDKNREATKKSLEVAAAITFSGAMDIITLPARAVGAGVNAALDAAIEKKKKAAAEADAKLPREKQSFISYNGNSIKENDFIEKLEKAGYTIEVPEPRQANRRYMEYINIYDKNHKIVGAFNAKTLYKADKSKVFLTCGEILVKKDCKGLQDAITSIGGKNGTPLELNCVKKETVAQNLQRKHNNAYASSSKGRAG